MKSLKQDETPKRQGHQHAERESRRGLLALLSTAVDGCAGLLTVDGTMAAF